MTGNDKRWKQEWSFAALGEFVLLTPCTNIYSGLEKHSQTIHSREVLGRHFTQGYLDMDKIP